MEQAKSKAWQCALIRQFALTKKHNSKPFMKGKSMHHYRTISSELDDYNRSWRNDQHPAMNANKLHEVSSRYAYIYMNIMRQKENGHRLLRWTCMIPTMVEKTIDGSLSFRLCGSTCTGEMTIPMVEIPFLSSNESLLSTLRRVI